MGETAKDKTKGLVLDKIPEGVIEGYIVKWKSRHGAYSSDVSQEFRFFIKKKMPLNMLML